MVYETDHIYARSKADNIRISEDPAGLQASHRHCNRKRGNSPLKVSLGRPSEAW